MTNADVDLFDFIPEIAAERQAAAAERHAARTQVLRDALTCLRDAVPEALRVVVSLEPWFEKDTCSPRKSEPWAYCVSLAGLRHEPFDEWARPRDDGPWGWDRTPANLTTWAELADLVGADPRRADVAAWVASVTATDGWRDLHRPFELWTHPETWHPSYIQGDHERPGWDDRIAAWRTVQAILTTALDCLP